MLKYIVVLAIGFAAPALAQSTVVQSVPFDTCVQDLQAPVAGALQPPVMTIDTDQVKEQQVQIPNGQVTVTCSRSDQTVTLKYQQ